MKNRALTKVIAALLAAMTIISTMAAGFTASAADMENASKKAAKAVITMGAGKIPVIGGFVSSVLDPILSELFGIKGDNAKILEKLDEIGKQLDALEATLEKDTQDILRNLNDTQHNAFNASITSLRQMVEDKYKFLRSIEKSTTSDYAKTVMTAEMLNFEQQYADEFEVLTQTLESYINGTQINFGSCRGIYEYVLMRKCEGTVIGGSAALAAADYVNEVNGILSNAYKLMILVLGEKLRFSEELRSGKIDEAGKNDEELRTALELMTSQEIARYKSNIYKNYWTELLVGEDGNEGLTEDYNAMFNAERADSAVSRYNAKVNEIWFSYIRDVKYTSDGVNVTFVPLNREISYTTAWKNGLTEEVGRYQVESMISKVSSNINKKITSALTKNEVKKLYEHFLSDEILSKDENGKTLSLLDALRDYGFTFDAWENSEEGTALKKGYEALAKIFEMMGVKPEVADKYYLTPLFAFDSSYKYKNVDNSTQCYWDATGTVKSYNGYAANLVSKTTAADGTVSYSFTSASNEYFSFHESRGCNKNVETDATFAIMYFTAA